MDGSQMGLMSENGFAPRLNTGPTLNQAEVMRKGLEGDVPKQNVRNRSDESEGPGTYRQQLRQTTRSTLKS